MTRILRSAVLTCLTLLGLLLAAPSFAQLPPPPAAPPPAITPPGSNGPVLLNLRDVDIRTLIDTVSKATGINFVVDPRVRGNVTVVSSTYRTRRKSAAPYCPMTTRGWTEPGTPFSRTNSTCRGVGGGG